jgi:hypothetical protein
MVKRDIQAINWVPVTSSHIKLNEKEGEGKMCYNTKETGERSLDGEMKCRRIKHGGNIFAPCYEDLESDYKKGGH